MFRWVPYPFLRFTPALIVGILLEVYLPTGVSLVESTFLFLTYLTVILIIPVRYRHKFSTPVGMLGLVILVLVGAGRVRQLDVVQRANHLIHYPNEYSHYIATITSAAERRTNSWRVTAQLEQVLAQDSSGTLQVSSPLQANILLYQPLADSLRLLRYGDRVLVKGSPKRIAPPGNPHAFDLQQYWAQQQIYHQQYLRASQWHFIDSRPPNRMIQLTICLRHYSQRLLRQAISNEEARGVVLALVLGIKDQLNDQVREAYGRVGAMHVLAVSGLHTGIVYGAIAFLLMPLRRVRWGKEIHALLCIAALWLFALVSGGSVSVMRATTMFTCIIIAEVTQRRSNIYNTLALSAFLLLLINPYYLLSVGFQLSYLAVLGIVYLQPRIYRLIVCRSGWLDKLWALTAVSIAAQIATLPISLYYFHQFPTYFWLANLFVIPAASVILSLGLSIIGVGTVIPSLISWLGLILEKAVLGVNALIFSLEQLPFSYVDRLHIDRLQVMGLYASIITLAMLFYYRRFRYLVFGCSFLWATVALHIYHDWLQCQWRGVTFYQTRGQSNVDFTYGKTNYHWGKWNSQAIYQVDPHHLQAGFTTTFIDTASTHSPVPLVHRDGLTLVAWQGKQLLFVQRPLQPLEASLPAVTVNYLIVGHNAVRQLSSLGKVSYDTLIIDSSNGLRQAQRLATEAASHGIIYHSVPTQGALRLTLSSKE